MRDKDGNVCCNINAATGKYDDKAYELVNNRWLSTLTERHVYAEARPDGAINYIVMKSNVFGQQNLMQQHW